MTLKQEKTICVGNKLLSIYIPTFNRPKELVELLTSIKREREKLINASLIEVVVSDNCSDADIESYLLSHNLVDKYLRNQSNLGADSNVMLYKENCSGSFVWLIGDDDLVGENSIVTLVELISKLENKKVGLIYLNYSIQSMSGDVVKESVISTNVEGMVKSTDLFEMVNNYLLTMSALVVRNNVSGFYTAQFGLRYYASPLAIALDVLELYPESYFVNNPLVKYREGDKSGWVHNWATIRLINVPYIMQEFCKKNHLKCCFLGLKDAPDFVDLCRLIINKDSYKNILFTNMIVNYLFKKSFYFNGLRAIPYIVKKVLKK